MLCIMNILTDGVKCGKCLQCEQMDGLVNDACAGVMLSDVC